MTDGCVHGAINFDDAAAYERFMGRASRAAGALFLDWVAPATRARWLEVGCGTGAFTQLVSERCRPATIVAVDPSAAQIAFARDRLPDVAFHVAAAEALPWPQASYDFVVSALTINFFSDRVAAVREMRRVSAAGATIAGYVWDFAAQRTPHAPVVRALRHLGVAAPSPPGGEECALAALHSLFARAALTAIEITALDIEVSFPDFAAFWTAQTPSFSPTTRLIARLEAGQRLRLKDMLRAELAIGTDGKIAYAARVHAVKARVP